MVIILYIFIICMFSYLDLFYLSVSLSVSLLRIHFYHISSYLNMFFRDLIDFYHFLTTYEMSVFCQ